MVKKPCLMTMCSINDLETQIQRKKSRLESLEQLSPTPLTREMIARLTREIKTLEQQIDNAQASGSAGSVELRGQTQRL